MYSFNANIMNGEMNVTQPSTVLVYALFILSSLYSSIALSSRVAANLLRAKNTNHTQWQKNMPKEFNRNFSSTFTRQANGARARVNNSAGTASPTNHSLANAFTQLATVFDGFRSHCRLNVS